jgi:hypothetical protein
MAPFPILDGFRIPFNKQDLKKSTNHLIFMADAPTTLDRCVIEVNAPCDVTLFVETPNGTLINFREFVLDSPSSVLWRDVELEWELGPFHRLYVNIDKKVNVMSTFVFQRRIAV